MGYDRPQAVIPVDSSISVIPVKYAIGTVTIPTLQSSLQPYIMPIIDLSISARASPVHQT